VLVFPLFLVGELVPETDSAERLFDSVIRTSLVACSSALLLLAIVDDWMLSQHEQKPVIGPMPKRWRRNGTCMQKAEMCSCVRLAAWLSG